MIDSRTKTQRYSDSIAEFCGSWGFIIWFTAIIVVWMGIQGRITNFDPYPYLLLNYALTITSTMQSPIIMMSQNRQVERDREHIAGLHLKLDILQSQLNILMERIK